MCLSLFSAKVFFSLKEDLHLKGYSRLVCNPQDWLVGVISSMRCFVCFPEFTINYLTVINQNLFPIQHFFYHISHSLKALNRTILNVHMGLKSNHIGKGVVCHLLRCFLSSPKSQLLYYKGEKRQKEDIYT